MMRYMHGDDSKASLVSVRARLAYCIAALLFIGCMIYLNYKVIHTEGFSLPLLLCTLVLICISSICILRMLWMNWKYSVHAEGITIKTYLSCRSIAWDSICSGRRTPLLTGKHVSKDYILIFLSEKPPTTFYDLPDFEHCWLNSDRIIPIRYTNERIQELQKFCPEKFSMN